MVKQIKTINYSIKAITVVNEGSKPQSALDSSKAYCSPYGWNLTLPQGWLALKQDPCEITHGLENVEVFVHAQDPSLSMTWMRTSRDTGLRLWRRFLEATIQMGSLPESEAQELMTHIFRLLGQVDTAGVISLPDGQRALEITEIIKSFNGTDEPMHGYHLVFPVKSSSTHGPHYMQQVSFYARKSKFAQEITIVMKSARSFHHL